MAIDPNKSKALTQVVRQHPVMSVLAVSPGIAIFVLLWIFGAEWLAIIFALAALGGGYYLLTRQK
ncbi:hypothetical protein GYA93_02510 [Gordonia desulfuricans]|uniref:Uncharacterized protein n=1 Tax=Gordonia desulfuricans TaxID=89051 RepID=A0A7K3LJS8_9ACTN|nr:MULTISPECIES: putative membrane protein [Gordonia]EMP10516.1 hypothetical protein ISGA_5684 [Gordonia sp. NB41Y]NDK88458.1 hypothetical protein [Gordonia desulfuricans]WLP92015.1 hypothetical protein Q9K23_07185 [Gordonia sp. NB41Y]